MTSPLDNASNKQISISDQKKLRFKSTTPSSVTGFILGKVLLLRHGLRRHLIIRVSDDVIFVSRIFFRIFQLLWRQKAA